jgi:hypothetical protein
MDLNPNTGKWDRPGHTHTVTHTSKLFSVQNKLNTRLAACFQQK